MNKNAKETAIYAGIGGIEMEGEFFDLGHGVTISRVYAHLMAPFLLAFQEAEPGKAHPGPWRSVADGLSYDMTAEIRIPETSPLDHRATLEIAKTLLFLIRLGINPAATIPVFSSYSLKELVGIPSSDTRLLPFEIMPRHFPLTVSNGVINESTSTWLKEHWKTVVALSANSQEFKLARDALDQGQFVSNPALTLVSLWSALEGLFSPSASELRFRVSALIATFLEDSGPTRVAMQKKVAALYDKRSAAAHGKPKHKDEDLLESFELLRSVLLKIISLGTVPSKESLEAALFGA